MRRQGWHHGRVEPPHLHGVVVVDAGLAAHGSALLPDGEPIHLIAVGRHGKAKRLDRQQPLHHHIMSGVVADLRGDSLRRPLARLVMRHVEAMTISFADEFLGRFYSSLAVGDVVTAGVLLSGFNDETREAVAICLERRDVTALAVDNDETILMGRFEPLADTTFQTVLELGEFRANDLAAALDITAQNANNRLKRLVEAGALQRRKRQSPTAAAKNSCTRSCRPQLKDSGNLASNSRAFLQAVAR